MSILDKIKALLEEEEKEIEETSPAWVESGEVEIPSEIVAQLKRLNNLKGAIIGRLARESVDWELKKASLVNNVRQIEKSILQITSDLKAENGIQEEEFVIIDIPEDDPESLTGFLRKK